MFYSNSTSFITFMIPQGFQALLLALALIIATSGALLAQEAPKDKKALEGTWTIDLRPSPDGQPYLKDFVIKFKGEKTFKGYFYDTPFSNGRINTNWEKVYFSCSTKDQNNAYYHTGYLLDGKLYGTTYCPERDFIAPWVGVPAD